MLEVKLSNDLQESVLARCGEKLDVTFHQSIDSTNSWSLRQCGDGVLLPFACFAEFQTDGRGRRGKHWLMPANSNIAMSLCWAFDTRYQSLQFLSLSIAMAIVNTLETIGIKDVQVKWPNDVYVSGKKIAGILIETRPVKGSFAQAAEVKTSIAAVIGVGLNYDMRAMTETAGSELRYDEHLPIFTDVCTQLGAPGDGVHLKTIERASLFHELLCQVVKVCQNYQADSRYYLQSYRQSYDYCLNKKVDVMQDDGETVSGTARGVNNDAELIVDIGGEHILFNSAQVSVKAN